MDNAEFKQEIIEYIANTYDSFIDYQKITQEILVEFDRITQKNHLDYYLAYGTLLGAVRDNSQIPWDYDIDTLVKISDMERLVELLDTELGDDFYYDYITKTQCYPAPCLRICQKGYSMMALHVDVFFLIGAPNETKKRESYIKDIKKTIRLRLSKYISLYLKETPQSNIGRLYYIVLNSVYKMIPGFLVRSKERKLLSKYRLEDSEYWISYQDVYDKVYPRYIFDSSSRLKFGDSFFSVPAGFEEFLNINYGNWHNYFPINERFDEFYNMKKIVDERQASYLESK